MALDREGKAIKLPQTPKQKEKPTLHLAQITSSLTKDEIKVIALRMAQELLGRPSENGV